MYGKEAVKPTQVPEELWEALSTEFGVPFPDGQYNLVIVDKRTRYSIVKEVSSSRYESRC